MLPELARKRIFREPVIARVGVTKHHSQSDSQMVVLWSGYGDSPETPDNKKLLEMYKVEPSL